MSSIEYRAEIDGLRTVAVLPVILFHMGFDWIPGGYIGVDIFFVISGYLITSIITRELEAGTFSFREFWARRVRRILPAMIAVTSVSLVFAYFFIFKGVHRQIGEQAMSALLCVANVYFWRNTGDYWGTRAEEAPFLHTWSLSVEEQFYLFLPVVVWLVFKFWPKLLRPLILFAVASSFCLFLFGLKDYPQPTFYLLPTRAWELALGCYLAIALARQRSQHREVGFTNALAVAGLCMILASYHFLPDLSGRLAIPVLGAALVIAFAQSGICHSVLAHPLVVYVGKMSYSLYLWHWPVLVFAKDLGFSSHRWSCVGLICLMSAASYHFVEKPTRRRRGIIPLIAVCYLLTLGFSCVLVLSPTDYDTSKFEPQTWYGLYYDLKPENEQNAAFRRLTANVTTPKRDAPPDSYLKGGIIVGDGDSDPRIVVFGDSHGVMWSDAIRLATEDLGIKTSFYSVNGVTPFARLPLASPLIERVESNEPDDAWKLQLQQARLDFIKAWKPQIVIVCTRWSQTNLETARPLLDELTEHASKVLLMEQPPELSIGNRNALQYLCFKHIYPEQGIKQYLPMGNTAEYEQGRSLVRTLAHQYPNCDFIPVYDLYSRDSQVLVLDGAQVVYLDDDHLLSYGARLGVERIKQAIADAVHSNQTTNPLK